MIGIAEALTFEEGREEDGDMPAGDAIDVGNMKSSIFMASGSGVFETSTDSRSLAIPEGTLVGCWLALQMRLSVLTSDAHVRSSGVKHTAPARAPYASGSWPSSSRSNSPFVLDLAIGTWSCYTASIFAYQAGPFFAFHRGRLGRRWRRRPSNLGKSSPGGGLFESACFPERCPVCLEWEGREEGLENFGCAMIVFALVPVREMIAGSRGWRTRGHSRGSL